VARALFGQIPARGHLPVTVPGVNLKAGFGMELPASPMTVQPMDLRGEAQLQPAYGVIEKAIADKAFPGGDAGGWLSRESGAPSVWKIKLRREGRRDDCEYDV